MFNRSSLIKIKNSMILTERKEYSEKHKTYPHVSLTIKGIEPKTERFERDFLVKEVSKNYKVTKVNDLCYNPANLKFGVITLNETIDGIFSPIYVTFEINRDLMLPKYAKHFYTRDSFIKSLMRYQEGTVYERMAVKPEDFLGIEIEIHKLEDQQKIGSFLSAIDEYINKLEKNLKTLSLKKQHYYSCLFNNELRFRDSKNNDFPNWKQIKLNDYGQFFKGTSYSRDDISRNGKNLILYGDLFTIYDGRINDTFYKTESSYPNEVYARPGDILFPGSTTVDAYSLISPSTLYCESVIGGDVIVYRTSKIRPLYLTHLIIGKLKKHFSKFAQGTTIIHIYSSSLGDIEFESSTSSVEQSKLEGFFDKFDKLIKLNNKKIEKMKSLKNYYIKKIFNNIEV